jgi:hypothetical protein
VLDRVRIEFPVDALTAGATVEVNEVDAVDLNAVPVVVHIADDGTWNGDEAAYIDGQIQIATGDFSLRIPAWLNPVEWIKCIFGGLTRLVGMRTNPPDCRTPPDWAVMLGSNSTAVHECMSTNPAASPRS